MRLILDLLALAGLLVIISTSTSAVEPENEINPEFDLRATTIIVNWFDTEEELQGALDDDELAGMAECEWRPEFNVSFCELWLVRPTEIDTWTFDPEQDVWKTIGHEFYHTVAGAFHK